MYTYSVRWTRDTLCPLMLALTSTTSGGRSVGIVRLRIQATENRLEYTSASWYSFTRRNWPHKISNSYEETYKIQMLNLNVCPTYLTYYRTMESKSETFLKPKLISPVSEHLLFKLENMLRRGNTNFNKQKYVILRILGVWTFTEVNAQIFHLSNSLYMNWKRNPLLSKKKNTYLVIT
jgi:hypothetical protein